MGPETKYARSGDLRIAYQVTGEGPVDLVWAPGTFSHLDMDWEWPARAGFIQRLSSFCRLIRFDKRGTGLSDRPTYAATLEERVDDIRAVMDSAGSDRSFIYGVSEGGSMALLFGATFPTRTRGIILWETQARWARTDDYQWGLSPEEYQRIIVDLAENGVTPSYVSGLGGHEIVDPAQLDWIMRYARAAGSPSAFAALERMNSQIDVRGILSTIRVPALIMNRSGDPIVKVEAARDLASKIPGAKFVEFAGEAPAVLGIADMELAQIEEFVAGTRWHAKSDRVLSTLLFMDIVESTQRLRAMGDERWRGLLGEHDSIVRSELAKFRGREVKTLGDGFLAAFDGPTRAIQCALAIRDSVAQLGIEVRGGLHTGECELVGEDVEGIAVNMAARVAEAAKPGQVLVSNTAKDLVAGSGLEFKDSGVHTLEGFSGRWRLFEAR